MSSSTLLTAIKKFSYNNNNSNNESVNTNNNNTNIIEIITNNIYNNNINNNNNNNDDDQTILIISDIFIWIYICFIIVIGLIANILILKTLFKIHCNGTLYILMQLCFCDIGTLLIAIIELFYINHSKWIQHLELCPIYLGMESFTCTAQFYFIIVLNLHGLSTWNLTVKTIERELRLQQEDTENDDYTTDSDTNNIQNNNNNIDTDTDSLKDDGHIQNKKASDTQNTSNITNSHNNNNNNNDNYEIAISVRRNHQPRSLTIDYRKRKLNISVLLPVIFIWFLAASISIPLFVFGNVLPNADSPQLCGIINFDYGNNLIMQILIILIRIGLPTTCLCITFIYILDKLYLTRLRLQQCGLDENAYEILRLSFYITVIFLLASIQYIYGSLLFETLAKPFSQIKYPLLTNRVYAVLLTMLHFSVATIRPFIYCLFNKNIRNEIRFCKWALQNIKLQNYH